MAALALKAHDAHQVDPEQRIAELAGILVCLDRIEEAKGLAKDLPKGLFRDAFFDFLTLSYADRGEVKKALKAAKTVDRLTQMADEIALRQARRGDIAGALRTIEFRSGVDERAVATLLIAKYQAKAGERSSAKALIESTINNPEVDRDYNRLTNALAIAYAWTGQADKWEKVVEQIVKRDEAIPPDGSYGEIGRIAVETFESGMAGQGIALALKIRDSYYQEIALTNIVDSLLKKGDEDRALKVIFDELTDDARSRDWMMPRLVKWYVAQGRYSDAESAMHEIEYLPLRIEAVVDIANALRAAGESAKTSQLVAEGYAMVEVRNNENTEPHIFSSAECIARLARVQIANQEIESAKQEIQQAVNLLRAGMGDKRELAVFCPYQLIFDAQIELKDFPAARETLKIAHAYFQKNAQEPYPFPLITNEQIAVCYAKLGDFQEALKIANFGEDAGRIAAYAVIARWLGSQGRTEEAIQWVQKHVPADMKLLAYVCIAQGLLENAGTPCSIWRSGGPSPFIGR